MTLSGETTWTLQYVIIPFFGGVVSIIFYDHVFLAYQELLAKEREVPQPESEESSEQGGIEASPDASPKTSPSLVVEQIKSEE